MKGEILAYLSMLVSRCQISAAALPSGAFSAVASDAAFDAEVHDVAQEVGD
jgi:hypothetical protein